MKTPCLILAVLACSLAQAETPQRIEAEQARIVSLRAEAEARYAADQKDCWQKFAVNDCLAAAKARRREVLSDLRRQEISLSDAERKRRGAERVRAIEEKTSTQKQELNSSTRLRAATEQATKEEHAAQKAAERPAALASQKERAAQRESQARQKAASEQAARDAKAARAAQEKAKVLERQKEAQERKDRVAKKLAEPKKEEVKPLPVPP
ncbi:MAG: hypothetical protein HYX47_21955 [Burkholderiales bacterium]|nr:hypothetical protein [Burkholderiales bacterium]